MKEIKWHAVLLVLLRALVAGLSALAADTAAGNPVAGILATLHPASLLVGGLVAAPLALLRRSASSSKMPVRRRSARASKSISE